MSVYMILAIRAQVQTPCLILTSIGKISLYSIHVILSMLVSVTLTYHYRTQFEDFYEANYQKYLKNTPQQQQQEHAITEQSYIMRCLQARNSGNG